MNKKILALALTGAFTAGTASAATIDTFDTTQEVLDASAADGGNSSSVVPVTSDFDNRTLTVDADVIGVPGNEMGSRINQAASGVMTMFADDQVSGSVHTDYTGAAVDFLAGGFDTITITVTGSDFSTNVTIHLMDALGGMSEATGITPSLVTQPTDVDFQYTPGGDFSPIAGGGADLTAITGVSFWYELGPNTDLTVDLLATNDRNPNPSVPEPSSIALLGLGLLGMSRFSRRKA